MVTTKERIVRAAEILFAERGYDGTSLRQITEDAGVNIAAVNYHFGSKEKLLTEVLDRVVVPINTERIRLLDRLEDEGESSVEQILAAFLLPDLLVLEELRGRDRDLPRFVSRMYSEASDLMQDIMGDQFAEIGKRFGAALGTALPHLDTDEVFWRLRCVVGIVVYMFAGIEAPGVSPMATGNAEKDLQRLLAVTVPMMTAPSREVVTA